MYYDRFVHAGAKLNDTDKAKLREINTQLATLQATFLRKLLAGTAAGALTVSGLTIPLQNTTQQPARSDDHTRFLDVRAAFPCGDFPAALSPATGFER